MIAMLMPLIALSQPGALLPEPRHNLVFDKAVRVWDEALPLGNGLLGALVWGDGTPLKISLDRTDLWDTRPVPEYHSDEYSYALMRQWEKEGRVDDLLRVYDMPYHRPAPTKIPAGRLEIALPGSAFKSTSLDLLTANARMAYESGAEADVWIDAEKPVGYVCIRGAKDVQIELVAPAFGGKEPGEAKPAISAGDLAQLGYSPPERKRETSATRGRCTGYVQQGWDGFAFAVCFAWRQDGDELRGAWSIASNWDGADPWSQAKSAAEEALSALTLGHAHRQHECWWRRFWERCGLRVPNPRIEKQWYLDTYKFGAASRRGAPPITLQGPWTADNGKLPPWKGDYHHDLNTELSYWPCYSGNHLEEGLAFLDWLWETRENCKEWTRRFFDMPGMAVPMTADLNNNQIGGWRQYTHSATTGAWLAHHFYLHWRYSRDPVFLKERAYPYLRDCAVFFQAVTNERDENGLRTLPLSSSPEINDNRPEAWFPSITNYDLALIRWCFEKTAELADELGDETDAAHWRARLAEMPPFSLGEDGRLLVAAGHPLESSHRHFSHLMAIHPLGLIDVSHGAQAAATVRASLAELDRLGTKAWTGYSFAWWASLAARARDGETAAKALDLFPYFTLRNSFHCNGDQSGKKLSNFTYRPFTLEGNFAAAAGLQEMLLQSHAGVIDLFPAIPADWKDVQFHGLRAQGGATVSATLSGGVVTDLAVDCVVADMPVRLPNGRLLHRHEKAPTQAWRPLGAGYVSTQNLEMKLTPVPPPAFGQDDGGEADYEIAIDPAQQFQRILGLGSSLEHATCYNLSKLPETERDQAIRAIVCPENGIGMNLMRICIGTSDFAPLPYYSYCDLPEGETDPDLVNFSIAKDRDYVLPILKRALELNPDLLFFASPWSPPGWMKRGGQLCGGAMDPEHFRAYAQYLAKFVKAYEAEGIPIHAITPQNEPSMISRSYPTCLWTGAKQAEFIGQHLGPVFEKQGIGALIWCFDHNFNNLPFPEAVLNDPDAAPCVDGTAFHLYEGKPEAMTELHQAFPGKHIYFTEGSTFGVGGAMRIIAFLRNWARTYNAWVTVLDQDRQPNSGPHHASPTCIILDTDTMQLEYRFDYYMYGQFMKFIQRGAVRIASEGGDRKFAHAAFWNPNGAIVLVIANRGGDCTARIQCAGQSALVQLPARCVATYCWPNYEHDQ